MAFSFSKQCLSLFLTYLFIVLPLHAQAQESDMGDMIADSTESAAPPAEQYPPAQQYPPPQQYPPAQQYPPPQQYPPAQQYPPPQQYPPAQQYPPPQQYPPAQQYPPPQQYPPQQYPPQQYAPQQYAQPAPSATDEYLKGKMEGQAAAKGSGWWVLAGLSGAGFCLCIGVAGIIVAALVPPKPPEQALIGKSSNYVLGYTEGYKSKGRWKNAGYASIGCALAAVINLVINLATGNNAFQQ
jgi:hypothetical protein